ncbi:oligoribonuclease [Thioalkalivibrio sp. ALJT]|uniref:oligoribonuclease n=1 Tax=Thioalkalivibrio sp. ALJT TaxID=1158146 RepID=UPI0003614B4A|nr:oligoribonuclease [Thioalkalivibrio sp. ALJT]
MAVNAENLIWIDLEMTGLEPQTDRILEVATIVTDKHLNILAEGPVVAVYQPAEVLEGMDAWNQRTHGNSGLIERVRNSAVEIRDAERATLEFLAQYVPKGASPMCGNSICQDRRFMARLMPELEQYFHYRNLDVSTLKELARRWAPDVIAQLRKNASHQALQDIRDSIDELRLYRERFIQLPPASQN